MGLKDKKEDIVISRRISELVQQLRMEIEEEGIDVTDNLPYDLFLLSTSLRPFVCAELLIRYRQGQILLSRRSDDYYGLDGRYPVAYCE